MPSYKSKKEYLESEEGKKYLAERDGKKVKDEPVKTKAPEDKKTEAQVKALSEVDADKLIAMETKDEVATYGLEFGVKIPKNLGLDKMKERLLPEVE